jgi:hypothetical protein
MTRKPMTGPTCNRCDVLSAGLPAVALPPHAVQASPPQPRLQAISRLSASAFATPSTPTMPGWRMMPMETLATA